MIVFDAYGPADRPKSQTERNEISGAKMDDWLTKPSEFAAIATAVVAVVAYSKYELTLYCHSKTLEEHLRRIKEEAKAESPPRKGQQTILQITRELGFPAEEILQISRRNKRVVRRVHLDPKTRFAETMLMEYRE